MAGRQLFIRLVCRDLLLVGLVSMVTGCSCFPTMWSIACKNEGWPVLAGKDGDTNSTDEPKGPPESALPVPGSGGQCYRYRIRKKTPKALLEWQVCKDKQKEEGDKKKKPDKEKKDSEEKKSNHVAETKGGN